MVLIHCIYIFSSSPSILMLSSKTLKHQQTRKPAHKAVSNKNIVFTVDVHSNQSVLVNSVVDCL